MLTILGYIGAVLMGLSLGMIGGGGSILSVPIFVYLFSIPPSLATAYSLFVVGLTSLVGFAGALKAKTVNLQVGIAFAIPSFIGVFATRRFVMPHIPAEIATLSGFVLTKDILVMVVFAILMVAASLSMIRKGKERKSADLSPAVKYAIIAAEGLIVGGVTGFVGAGGGFLIIPALVVLAGLSMKIAVGTSLGIIAAKSLIGFVGDLGAGQTIDWQFLVVFSALAIIGIIVGQRLSQKVSDQKLKPAFGYFVLVMGCFILIQQLMS